MTEQDRYAQHVADSERQLKKLLALANAKVALERARQFDQPEHFTRNAHAMIASIDQEIGMTRARRKAADLNREQSIKRLALIDPEAASRLI